MDIETISKYQIKLYNNQHRLEEEHKKLCLKTNQLMDMAFNLNKQPILTMADVESLKFFLKGGNNVAILQEMWKKNPT